MKYFLSIIFSALSLTSAHYFGDGGLLGGNTYGTPGPYGQLYPEQQQQPQTQDYFGGGFGYGYGPSFASGLDQLQQQQPQQQQRGHYFKGAPYG
ncbi:maternal protein pumilio-like [Drosophila madeirensis]|uniref:Maternal protein pumilio-like n=1 Tax=Drosophila madeirensis TaxID=30013 RepID=A0AAU9FC09_DROMD